MFHGVLRFREVIQHSIFVFDVFCNINSMPQKCAGHILVNLRNNSVHVGIDPALLERWKVECDKLICDAKQEAKDLAKFLNGGAQG